MKTRNKIENDLISKINKVLKEFETYNKPFINNNGNIIIEKKRIKEKIITSQF